MIFCSLWGLGSVLNRAFFRIRNFSLEKVLPSRSVWFQMRQKIDEGRYLVAARFLTAALFSVLVAGVLGAAPLRAATVVLDPGHGGYDPGGVPRQRFIEKKVTLEIAKRIEARLRAAGHKVIMTRTDDVFVELDDRVDISNSAPSRAVFVSIHCNSAPSSAPHGIETYHYSSRSARLAQAIHSRVVAATGAEDRGVRKARFFVLRNNRRVAVLVEMGFLTNSKEGAKLARDKRYQEKVAAAVAAGIQSVVR